MVLIGPTMFKPGCIWYVIDDLFNPEIHDDAKRAFSRIPAGRNTLDMIKLISLLSRS